jgi:cholesterol oxidase
VKKIKEEKSTPTDRSKVSRREFLRTSASAGAAAIVPTLSYGLTPTRFSGTEHRQVIIVGSGFGGAITAWRLAQNGIRSTILEKGQRWDQPLENGETRFSPNLYPDGRSTWLSHWTKIPLGPALPIPWRPGVLEGRDMDRFRIMSGSAYGGGSIIYGGVQVKPEKRIFEKVFPEQVPFDELEPYYARVSAILGRSTVPDDVLHSQNYQHVRVAHEHSLNAGIRSVKLHTATDWDIVRQEINGQIEPSVIQGEAVYGVNSGAKATLDNTYLAYAEQADMLEVKTLTEVTHIGSTSEGGFYINVIERNQWGFVIGSKSYTCDYLFLCAGSVGTSSLLVKAKAKKTLTELNDEVGQGFGNNGNVYSLRIGPEPTGKWHAGPPSIGIEDFDNPHTPLFVEHPQLPLGLEFYGLLYFGVGITKTRGYFYYDWFTDRVKLKWPRGVDLGQQQVTQALLDNMNKLNEVNGGSIDSVVSKALFAGKTYKDDAIYHPLGGCVMGKACDYFGRIKNYNRLYVSDGAFMPGSSACTNPRAIAL